MSKSLRTYFIRKLAQEEAPKLPTETIQSSNKIYSENINDYKSFILTLAGVNSKLFSDLIWVEIAKFIGILDHLLAGYTKSQMNFKSLVINNQTLNSAMYPNNVGMTDIIKIAHSIFTTITEKGTKNYNKDQINQIIKDLNNLISSSSITSGVDSRVINVSSPKSNLQNILTNINNLTANLK